ncbi:MAG: hypothetical protein J7518_16870 [Nocardioidaceae bacterium]|nr:hypothetical protein [Nocardioidaceae bacterium]
MPVCAGAAIVALPLLVGSVDAVEAGRAPRPAMTVRVPLRASVAGTQAALDRCAGAVATPYPGGHLVSQHDYCSNRWVLRLEVGQVVRFTGELQGSYRVRAATTRRRHTGTYADLAKAVGGTVQAVMCSSRTTVRWVGLTRVR